ncbi:MAG: hypothetical protein RLZZ182_2729 [Pseudomonadota bacterium]
MNKIRNPLSMVHCAVVALGLMASAAQAQVASMMSIAVKSGDEVRTLQDSDYLQYARSTSTNYVLNNLFQDTETISERVLKQMPDTIYYDETGQPMVWELYEHTEKSVTTQLSGTQFTESAFASLYAAEGVGPISQVDVSFKPIDDRFYLALVIHGFSNKAEFSTMDPANLPLTLFVEGQAYAGNLFESTSMTYSEAGSWEAFLYLTESFTDSNYSFQLNENHSLSDISVSYIGRLGPLTATEQVTTYTALDWRMVPFTDTAPVPEPSTWALAALGLGWLVSRAPKARALAA